MNSEKHTSEPTTREQKQAVNEEKTQSGKGKICHSQEQLFILKSKLLIN